MGKHNRPKLHLPTWSNQPANQPTSQPTQSKMSQETILDGYQGKYQDKYLASSEFGKEASGTIGDYLTGTINLVFIVFFLFLVLSMLTVVLTMYARYQGRPKAPSSFEHPPPRAYRPNLQEFPSVPPASTGQSTLL